MMKEKLELKSDSISEIVDLFQGKTMKLKDIIDGIVRYVSVVPFQHEDIMGEVEIDFFFNDCSYLSYDNFEDLVRQNDMVFEVSYCGESIFFKTFDKYIEEYGNEPI